MSPEESFAAFAKRIHSERPIDGGTKIDLRALAVSKDRKMCGDHGRIVPTKQDLCPKCGGIVVAIAPRRMAPRRMAPRRRSYAKRAAAVLRRVLRGIVRLP